MARITTLVASASLVSFLAACSHPLAPAAPRGSIFTLGYPFGFPISAGGTVELTASWSGTCETPTLRGLSMGTRLSDCDEKSYSLRIECRDDTLAEPSLAETPCKIRRGARLVGRNLVEAHDVRGTQSYLVELTGKQQVSIVLTLQRGRETRIYQSPRLQVVVPDDFVVECQQHDGSARTRTVSCDDEFSPNNPPSIVVRGTNGITLSTIRINGKRALNGDPMALCQVLPRGVQTSCFEAFPPGDYPIRVDVNPPPHTIHRDVILKIGRPVRPD